MSVTPKPVHREERKMVDLFMDYAKDNGLALSEPSCKIIFQRLPYKHDFALRWISVGLVEI